jgi:hypothetical protein
LNTYLAGEAVKQHSVARMSYIPPNVVMLYAPRNAGEIDIVASWLQRLTVTLGTQELTPWCTRQNQ